MRFLSILSTNRSLSAILVLALIILLWLTRRGLHKLGKNLPSSATWGKYLKGQGLLLFLVLLTGGLFARGGAYFASGGTVSKGVQLIQFDKVNPSEHPVYEEIDVGQYSNVTILAKTMVPDHASATVAIYSDRNDASGTFYEVKRLESVSDTWSQWEQANPGKHLSIVITPPSQPGVTSATEITVRVYLSPK